MVVITWQGLPIPAVYLDTETESMIELLVGVEEEDNGKDQ